MALYKRNGVYWVSFTTPDGKRIRKSTNTADKKQAQEFFDKLKHESWRLSRMGEKPRHTWDEATALWLQERTDKKSIEYDALIIQSVLTPAFGGRYLDEITKESIAAFVSDKRKTLKPGSINRYLTLVRAILMRATKIWEWLDKVPTIPTLKEPRNRIRYLSQDEVNRLMNELTGYLKPIVSFALLTGLRKSNIINLRWSQIDFEKKMIIISGKEMKNGEDHVVYLSSKMLSILQSQKGMHSEYVFTRNGKRVKSLDWKFRNALKRAGISDYRFHDNRHTWASTLIQNGVSLYELQEMGGWKTTNMVKRYAHLSSDKLRKNAAIAEVIFDKTVNKE